MVGSIRVLHVDDDRDFAELVATFLERQNNRFEVETVTQPDSALGRLGDVDCVVCDHDMPGMTGIEVLKSVREEHPSLPFILFTGKGSEEVASEAISAGVTDYLQKGSDAQNYELLANRITNAVEAARSQQTLTERTRRLETLIGNLPGMVYRCRNEAGRPLETVEGNVEKLTGYTATALETEETPWDETMVHPDDRADLRDSVQAALAKQNSFAVTYRIRTADDRTRWLIERGRGVSALEDSIDTMEGFIMDITDRRRRERSLRRTSARLEALFENSPDMINVHDTEGNLIDPNPQLCQKTGYDEEELIGMKVWDLDPTIDPTEADALWGGMEVGGRRRLNGRFQRKDGSTFPVEIHVRRLDLDGDDRFVVISRDTTEREQDEQQLRQ